MLPYVGTASQKQLLDEGRFYETNLQADYDFLDPRLDTYYKWLLRTFDSRNFTRTGTLNLLRIVQFQANLRKVGPVLDAAVRGIIAANNQAVFDALEEALNHVESTPDAAPEEGFLALLTELQARADAHSRLDLGAFELVFAGQEMSRGPVCEAV